MNDVPATKAELASLAELRQGRARRERGQCLVEGARLLAEALAAGCVPELVIVEAGLPEAARSGAVPGGASRDVVAAAAEAGARVVTAEARRIAQASDREHAAGLLASVPVPPPFALSGTVAAPAQACLVVLLCGVQDPGNVGTLVRSARAFGATGLLSVSGTADPLGPKALRASAGAALHLPHAGVEPGVLFDWADAQDLEVVAAWAPGGPATPGERAANAGLPARCLLLLGHETRGVEAVLAAAPGRTVLGVSVDQAPDTESLNVSMAGSVLMADWYRRHGERLSP